MAPRKCLDCPRLIGGGSRCDACRRAHERRRGQRRSSYSRGGWATAVKRRDGYRCARCGSPYELEAHHILPLSRGGADEVANGVTLCRDCHLEMHRGQSQAKAR